MQYDAGTLGHMHIALNCCNATMIGLLEIMTGWHDRQGQQGLGAKDAMPW